MRIHKENPEDTTEITKKIRSGEFFRESRSMYDFAVHDPMSERYFYLLITGLAAVILFIALIAMNGFYPLQRSVPFIVSTDNITEDRPNIRSLITYKGESPGEALLRFLAQNYTIMREDYDISLIDRNNSGVEAQSSSDVYQEYQQLVDPRNPESPIALYQRHSKRRIAVQSVRILSDDLLQVTFDAFVENKNETQKTRWLADISFTYGGVELDKETDQVKPLSFMVTRYKVKRQQESK